MYCKLCFIVIRRPKEVETTSVTATSVKLLVTIPIDSPASGQTFTVRYTSDGKHWNETHKYAYKGETGVTVEITELQPGTTYDYYVKTRKKYIICWKKSAQQQFTSEYYSKGVSLWSGNKPTTLLIKPRKINFLVLIKFIWATASEHRPLFKYFKKQSLPTQDYRTQQTVDS